MTPEFTPRARRDLYEIGDYIARDSQKQALRFVIGLERFCTKLVMQPQRYPLLPHRRDHAVRRAPFRDYLVFYRVGGAGVEILRVLYSARDTDTIAESL